MCSGALLAGGRRPGSGPSAAVASVGQRYRACRRVARVCYMPVVRTDEPARLWAPHIGRHPLDISARAAAASKRALLNGLW
jgi:hypothetical protein